MTLTLKQARQKGYDVVRGAYHGTTDDRADRWYIMDRSSPVIDRRGSGYRTRKEALEALTEALALRGEL
ncbi:MAG: hypothetical protein AB2448_01825 [Moorella sp. (in: firmicutes)]